MKYHLITFGCQMNESDSEKIAKILRKSAYQSASNLNEADLVVVNMCSVRQSAVNRVYGIVEKLKALPADKQVKTILTGCILRKDRKKFEKYFDLILDIKDLKNWPKKLQYYGLAYGTKNLKIELKVSKTAFVPIMTGCNNFCSYCVVPYTRGKEISRPAKEIICEVKKLIKNRVKEIWLLGQNVNSYKGELKVQSSCLPAGRAKRKTTTQNSKLINFPQLLKLINKIPGKFWIRFTSSHPKDFSDDLIKVMKFCKKITPYLNLPVQAGDDEILKKMNRPYAVVQYKKIIKKIRKEIPDICLSTDVIVGFPGETKKQFENTVKLFEEIKYDMAYISQYSPRPGTAGVKLFDNVFLKEKDRRKKVLNEILKKTALENNKKYIGKTAEVLIMDDGIGKTITNKTVKFQVSGSLPVRQAGKLQDFVKVKMTNASPWSLEGKYVNPVEKFWVTPSNKISQNSSTGLSKIIVIVGPNASGKTDLAIKIAKKFQGEIVSADSRQVYKGMDIGTGKATKKERQGISHYLLDVASPKTRFDVVKYRKLALKAIKKIQKKNKLPILVGGTGFYIQAVVDGLIVPPVKPDWKLRKKLEQKTNKELFKMLEKIDPNRAKTIDKNNPRRLVRALEIIIKTKKPIPPLETRPPKFEVLIIGVKRNQKELRKRIKKRLFKRLKAGMIAEVKKLHNPPAGGGVSWKKLEEFGLEYRYIAFFLQGKLTKQEMIEKLQKEIEHYAKRQMTWFKKDQRIHWISNYNQAKNIITKTINL